MLNGCLQNRWQVSNAVLLHWQMQIPQPPPFSSVLSKHTPPLPPYNLDCCLVCPTVLILTFVTVTLLRSGPWNHHSTWGSDLPPDLAQTLILANQHTSQQCPEAMRALQKPATHKCSCKQSVICLCLWIKCLRGGLSACLGTVCLHQKLVFVDGRLVRVASNWLAADFTPNKSPRIH